MLYLELGHFYGLYHHKQQKTCMCITKFSLQKQCSLSFSHFIQIKYIQYLPLWNIFFVILINILCVYFSVPKLSLDDVVGDDNDLVCNIYSIILYVIIVFVCIINTFLNHIF